MPVENKAIRHEDEDVPRRTFFKILIAALNGLIGLAFAIPGAGYILTPLLQKREGSWMEIGRVNDFPEENVAKAVFRYVDTTSYAHEEKQNFAWVRRQADGQVVAFSPKCTHMGCNVSWNAVTAQFECPCHGGRYDAQGNVIAGPPPRPLERYATKIENDFVLIQHRVS